METRGAGGETESEINENESKNWRTPETGKHTDARCSHKPYSHISSQHLCHLCGTSTRRGGHTPSDAGTRHADALQPGASVHAFACRCRVGIHAHHAARMRTHHMRAHTEKTKHVQVSAERKPAIDRARDRSLPLARQPAGRLQTAQSQVSAELPHSLTTQQTLHCCNTHPFVPALKS